MSSIDLILILQVFLLLLIRKLTNEGIKRYHQEKVLAKIQTKIAIQKLELNLKVKYPLNIHPQLGIKITLQKPGKSMVLVSLQIHLLRELVSKNVNIVVHSFKDLPVKNSSKTSFVCLERDDPRDVILIKKSSLNKRKLVISTSSPRRKYYLRLLKNYLPFQSLKATSIRGNVQTRLKKF